MGSGYKSRRWRTLREKILRRDKYLCQENARYGRMIEATTVHHIWPAEDYPQYAWCEWNLVSLSAAAHNAMHDRETKKLTKLGEAWRERTPPPPPGASFCPGGDRWGAPFPIEPGSWKFFSGRRRGPNGSCGHN